MKKIMKKGFTLIELMVVMAIIGGLSTMAFIYLQGARDKGADTAIRSVLTGLMSLAEIYYDNNNFSYANLNAYVGVGGVGASCGSATGVNKKICDSAARIRKESKSDTLAVYSDGGSWVIASPLKSSASTIWCVDYNLINKQGAGITIAASITSTSIGPFACL